MTGAVPPVDAEGRDAWAAEAPPPGGAPGPVEAFDATRSLAASGVLGELAAAGVLHAADVHVARLLGRLAGSIAGRGDVRGGLRGDAPGARSGSSVDRASPPVLLAAALAVRALRLGSVGVDLATVETLVAAEAGEAAEGSGSGAGAGTGVGSEADARLSWPELGEWLADLEASPLVATGPDAGPAASGNRPLRLDGGLLYLDRYWRDECLVAADIERRCARRPAVDEGLLRAGLVSLFGSGGGSGGGAGGGTPPLDRQRLAVACALLRGFSVVSGGPGTGKTTTVARLLALAHEQSCAVAGRPPLVALVAPTGKAAARLEQAVHEEADRIGSAASLWPTSQWMTSLHGSTVHRLLGRLPRHDSRFRHHAENRLPHDLVVVDEASMVSLSLMARLLEAVQPEARVVLVGDHEQLASVEAGSVLGDIVGPAASRLRLGPAMAGRLRELTGEDVEAGTAGPPEASAPGGAAIAGAPPVADSVVVLTRIHRFGGAIAELARAIQRADTEGVLAVLSGAAAAGIEQEVAGEGGVGWLGCDATTATPELLAPVRAWALELGEGLLAAADAGDGELALRALGRFRLLCANRRGRYGVTGWQQRLEGWIRGGVTGFAAAEQWAAGKRWYAGLPLLVTANDYDLGLYNGDAGVVVAGDGGRLVAVFESAGPDRRYGLDRLADVERCFATTVHKGQGSQFDQVAVVLPDAASPILTRELLYTAVTRARRSVIVVGSEEAVRAAVERPIARASGLGRRLWRPETGGDAS